MAQLRTRTLQTREGGWTYDAAAGRPPPELVVVSLGGNDFNHQGDKVPTDATFSSAYAALLDAVFAEAGSALRAVAAVCGTGSPAEAKFDPDNNRCRPCPHVEAAVAAYRSARPERRVEYFFVPCDGSVVNDHGDIGCNGHKNGKGQGEVAAFLEPKLRALMGW